MSALLLTTLLLSFIGWPGWASLVMAAAVAWAVLGRHRSALRAARPALVPFGALLVIGIVGFLKHTAYDAAKDLWYFSKPLIEIAFGCLVVHRAGARRTLWILMSAAVVVSVAHTSAIILDFRTFLESDTYTNRKSFGPGNFLSVVGIVILLHPSLRRLLQGRSPFARIAMFVAASVSALSLALSLSRTLAVALLFFVMLHALNARRRIAVIAGVLVVVASGTAILGSSEFELDPEKVLVALEELRVQDYAKAEDMSAHWRGYESFLAIRQFRSFPLIEQAFGGGFGELVNLDSTQTLKGEDMDALPILHNGYVHVLVKTGIVGLAVFMYALFRLWRVLRVRGDAPASRAASTLATWLAATLAFTSAVISGPFNKTELVSVMVLCGALAVIHAALREQRGAASPETRCHNVSSSLSYNAGPAERA